MKRKKCKVLDFNCNTYSNDDSGASAFLSDLSAIYGGTPQMTREDDGKPSYDISQILDHERAGDNFKSS